MAELNLDYYTAKDHYSDGDIEETLLKMAQEGKSFEDLPEDEVSFPMVYHFSGLRENILSWYPLKKTDSVLEIGAGCGAITGMLCRKAGHVTSVELSKRRADINFARNKEKENLTIMVGNLNDMTFPEKFDYVVVNGVLEYAMSFTEGKTPYETFLQRMGAYLKPEGRLLIAIENRLGLKYFAGAPEDHTDLHFFGINGYPGNQSVRTFSKNELGELLENSGFPFLRFYYPYPDYKFPTEIFTDESLYTNSYGRNYPVYTDKTADLFAESEGVKAFEKEKILNSFVNSFLVEAGRTENQDPEEILYVKLNQGRKEKFRLLTRIVRENEEVRAEKEAMVPQAEEFVEKLEKLGTESTGSDKYRNLPCKAESGKISYPLLTGKTLHQEIAELAHKGEIEEIKILLKKFYQEFFGARKVMGYRTEEFCEVFGEYPGRSDYECVCPANVDLICSNIFMGENGNQIIDYEWMFDFPVPVNFIMWRLIHELYTHISELPQLCHEDEMMAEFEIGYTDYEIFMKWTMHFVYEYVGCDTMMPFEQKRMPVSVTDIINREKEKHQMHSKVYYDLGGGFCEEHTLHVEGKLTGSCFRVEFDLSGIEGIQNIRWNPANGHFLKVKVERLDCGCSARLVPQGVHMTVDGSTTAFFTTDGFYLIQVMHPEKVDKIVIEGKLETLELSDVEKLLAQQKADEERKAQEKAKKAAQKAAEEAAEEALRHPGKKAQVKRLIKKVLRYNSAPAAVQSVEATPTCMGSVDFFHYEDCILNTVGWAFDPTFQEMGQPRIVFYEDTRKLQESALTTIYRTDVAQAIGNPDAESAGFSFQATVLAPKETTVFLEYGKNGDTGRFLLGKVPATQGQEEFLVSAIEDPKSIGNLRHFKQRHVRSARKDYPQAVYQQKVDVIVPVYNGLEYFDALFSGIEKTKVPYRLIIVNDKSPDPEVGKYLEKYAAEHDNVVLLNNETNMGFLPSVNRALKMAENHVALVNTDVEVPEEWLERLMLPIFAKEKIATTTPFTTCGTICSFPDFCRDNKLFEGMPLWEIDDEFRMIRPQYPSMPTGVGFCMGMNLKAIREVGLLDEENFGKGYGEENDWCQRAIAAGYENVHVDNLFVYHKHGGSFPSEEKQRLLKEHSDALLRKHPDYNKDTADYCRRDPLRPVRLYVEMKLLNKKLDVPTIVAFDHDLGGGATAYLVEKRRLALREGYRFVTIRYNIVSNRFYFTYQYKQYEMEFFANDLETALGELMRVDEIWINELVTYQNLYENLERILRLKREQGAKILMLLHDFFALCPAVNLIDARGKYCGVPSCEVCDKCVPDNRSNACTEYGSGTLWRTKFREFLLNCDEIRAFSDDTAKLFKRAYPDVYNLHVIPHAPHYLPAVKKTRKTTETFNIGLIGVLCYKKGLEVVKALVKYIEENDLNIRLRLIGTSDEEIESPVFSQTGRYTREEIPRLTLEQDIDMFLIPSVWPETFSYTTSEIISMGFPVAVLPVGAPVERVKRYEKGLVLKNEQPENIVEEMISLWKTLGENEFPVENRKILFVGEEISFASRYRVEHFREQLILNGYASKFIQMDQTEQENIEEYTAVVMYRCSKLMEAEMLVNRAKAAGIPVYYDVDDLVFDYEKISGLHFLKGSEYSDFRTTTDRIHGCMEFCDGYFTSTETLAGEIREEFPGKPVVINRNCMSMEMEVLSHEAVEQTDKDKDRIYIGYLSGSKTHDQDFAQVEAALLEVMQRHPEVYLKLVGVLDESGMEPVQNRIEKLPFMDWRQLPGVIAGLDINLMPLENSLFHCCKSENKWTEAALVKVPSVMSRNREMEYVIENGKDGWMCATKEEWVSALESLVTDEKARKAMGEAAHEKVMEHYLTENTGKDAMEELLCSESYTK